MSFEIATGRLTLRPLSSDDSDRLHEIFIEPGVRRYLFDDEILPKEDVEGFIQQSAESFDKEGYGLWAIVPRGENTIAGVCGYWFFHKPPELELLYLLSENHWSKGLAVEASQAVMEYGFDRLGFTRVQASTDAPNLASVRVMEKLGMRFLKRETLAGLETIFYAVTKEAFASQPRQKH